MVILRKMLQVPIKTSFFFNYLRTKIKPDIDPQGQCTPSGVACYQSLVTEYQCLPSCTGIYADINEEPMKEDQKESIQKMQEEYIAYKNSFGGLIPFQFFDEIGGRNGE